MSGAVTRGCQSLVETPFPAGSPRPLTLIFIYVFIFGACFPHPEDSFDLDDWFPVLGLVLIPSLLFLILCLLPILPWADFAIDMDLNIVQAGTAIQHLMPEMAFTGTKISEVLQIRHPRSPWDLNHLLQFEFSSKMVLSSAQGLELKGGLYKVKQMQRDEKGALMEGKDVVL